MLVRFCTLRRDPYSHSPQGVFHSALALRDDDQLECYEEEWLEAEMSWLNMHLPVPKCLREDGNERAICWFRPNASHAIDKVRSIVALLESKGVWVEMVTTADPGTILYEDQWQIVAMPRRKRLRAQSSQLIGSHRTRNTFRKSDVIEVSHSASGR